MNAPQCSSVDLISDELIELVDFFAARLQLLDDATVRHRPSRDQWAIIEVVGHLVDSAANNHQRFVRAAESESLTFPAYNQNSWVSTQDYRTCPWENLLALWKAYNIHLAHVIRRIPDAKMRIECAIQPNEPVSLSFLVEDYLVHLKHHLNMINERLGI